MHVLVTEERFGDSTTLVRYLRGNGYRVSTCHARVGLCRAVAPGAGCPLDCSAVDLVVDVRAGGAELTAREYGAICGVRATVPVMIVDVDPERSPVCPVGLERRVTATRLPELLAACQSWRHNRTLTGLPA